MKVTTITSFGGNPIPTQVIVNDNGITWFTSYGRNIVKITPEGVFLDEKYWNFSKTTGKYRNIFLNEDKKATDKKIKSGEYTLVNLN